MQYRVTGLGRSLRASFIGLLMGCADAPFDTAAHAELDPSWPTSSVLDELPLEPFGPRTVAPRARVSGLDVAPFAMTRVHKARLQLHGPGRDGFEVAQSFRLSTHNDGIDPANEVVHIRVGSYDELIPAGEFRPIGRYDGWEASFRTHIWALVADEARGVQSAVIVLFADGRGFITYDGRGVDLSAMAQDLAARAVSFRLQIGDDVGDDDARLEPRDATWVGPR